MKTPSIDELKRKVAEMLPGHISEFPEGGYLVCPFGWITDGREVRETEWLHICLMVFKTLTFVDRQKFVFLLLEVALTEDGEELCPIEELTTGSWATIGTWAQAFKADVSKWLEALCRVKHPEIFTT